MIVLRLPDGALLVILPDGTEIRVERDGRVNGSARGALVEPAA